MVKAKRKPSRPQGDTKESAQAKPAPIYSEPTECHDPYLLDDDEAWLIWMEPILCDNPGAAESLAHLLFTLKQAIESGPEGTARAIHTLADGIRIAYKYTEAHKAALRLYNLYLGDKLRGDDSPVRLLTAAIERANQEPIPSKGSDRAE